MWSRAAFRALIFKLSRQRRLHPRPPLNRRVANPLRLSPKLQERLYLAGDNSHTIHDITLDDTGLIKIGPNQDAPRNAIATLHGLHHETAYP
jgi:hypothetical protein